MLPIILLICLSINVDIGSCCLIGSPGCIDPSIVKYSDGVAKGLLSNSHRTFFGLPFARPPIGSLRWSDPIAPVGWGGVRDCTYQRESCPQSCGRSSFTCPAGISEDCLHLTIYAPLDSLVATAELAGGIPSVNYPSQAPQAAAPEKNVNATASLKPVLVFIPGSSQSPLYDGKQFAENGIIVVVVNYRLGALGFLGNKDAGIKGNFGFQDQLAALRWVKKNIAAFGGDANKVTLAGQAVGAMSVLTHLISPLSKGLFQSVVVQSAPTTLGYHTNVTARHFYDHFTDRANCTQNTNNDLLDLDYEMNATLSCLKELSVNKIVEIQEDISESIVRDRSANPLRLYAQWIPMIDVEVIPEQPIPMLENGRFNKVNIILGDDETKLFNYFGDSESKFDRHEFTTFISRIFRDKKQKNKIIDMYNRTPSSSNKQPLRTINENDDHRQLLNEILNDLMFKCPSRYIVRCISQSKSNNNYNYYNYLNLNNNVYYYRYKHINSFSKNKDKLHCNNNNNTCHDIIDEIPFVFNSYNKIGLNISEEEKQMGEFISKYWSNFVVNQNPNLGHHIPIQWSKYTENSYQNNALVLDTIPFSYNFDNDIAACNYLDEIGYNNIPII